jgi:1-phosphofructokinase
MTSQIVTITLNPAIDQSIAIPGFSAGAVNRVTWEQADPGGKGVNVASFLADFGLPVSVSGFLGQENAQIFQALFERKSISDRFVRLAGRTRTNIKIIDDRLDQVTDINFPGPLPTQADLERLHQTIDQLIADQDWFVLSGSLPTGLPASLYAELTQRLKAAGKTVVLDASGDSFRQAIAAAPDAVKPNLEELQEALGRPLRNPTEVVEAAQTLLAQGIATVVVSMGAQGAIFVEADQALLARPPQIKLVSTVGAGDAMVAGLITSKLRGFSLSDCARLATAFSLGALSQVGPNLPPPAAIEAFTQQVEIEVLHPALSQSLS